ncbi:hypothetical protein [Bacillus sp. DNRA2]|nr:hypothetical protein [Bacillus sp. DNRA2]
MRKKNQGFRVYLLQYGEKGCPNGKDISFVDVGDSDEDEVPYL